MTTWISACLTSNFGHDSLGSWLKTFGSLNWLLWNFRNDVVFNGRDRSSMGLSYYVRRGLHFLEQVKGDDQLAALSPHYSQVNVGWTFPMHDWIKCNVDGSVKFGTAGCGGVFRDSSGTWLCGFARNLGSTSVVFAELWGVFTALSIAWDRNIPKV